MKFHTSTFLHQTVLLAPDGSSIPSSFRRIEQDETRHSELLAEVQQLRGRIMLEEGATTPDKLDRCGRHRPKVDDEAWHMVSIGEDGRVGGCFRFLVHPSDVPLRKLNMRRAAAAGSARWAQRVREALEGELAIVRNHAFSLIEFGGWVLSQELRGTAEAFKMALIAFAWSQLAGGCFGLTTATVHHGSSSILRRVGGVPLAARGEPIPQYFDPEYNCKMEMLRFDSRVPNPRYSGMVGDVRSALTSTLIVQKPMRQQLAVAC